MDGRKRDKILKAYEARPYYYGRQALDLPSHATANIRAYEETLKESLRFADLHRKMAVAQQNNQKSAAVIADRDLTAENSEYDEDKEL